MEHAASVIAVSILLLSAGAFIAYQYYNVKYQSPVVLPSTTATLNLFATTSQKLATNVTSLSIFFSEIDIHPVGNSTWAKLFTTQTSIDLVKIVNVAQSIGSFQLTPGSYDAVRVAISQSKEILAGTEVPLQVPAAAQSGLTVTFPSQFNLAKGSTGDITLQVSADPSALAIKSLNPTISATLTLGMGATTGTTLLSTTFSTSLSVTTTASSSTSTQSCVFGIPVWPFCG